VGGRLQRQWGTQQDRKENGKGQQTLTEQEEWEGNREGEETRQDQSKHGEEMQGQCNGRRTMVGTLSDTALQKDAALKRPPNWAHLT
jgi:hypothetical protein